MGLLGYYRRFIEDFSRLVSPMTRLTWKGVKFDWDDLCERAFQEIKKETNFSSYSVNPEKGTNVHSILGCFERRIGMCFNVVWEGYGL